MAKALRERLHALAVLEDGALSRLRDARVFYVCGTDHAQKCGLYGGDLKRAAGVGTVGLHRRRVRDRRRSPGGALGGALGELLLRRRRRVIAEEHSAWRQARTSGCSAIDE